MTNGHVDGPPAVIRRATTANLPSVGRLGAMLLRARDTFDPDRFMRAGEGAEEVMLELTLELRDDQTGARD